MAHILSLLAILISFLLPSFSHAEIQSECFRQNRAEFLKRAQATLNQFDPELAPKLTLGNVSGFVFRRGTEDELSVQFNSIDKPDLIVAIVDIYLDAEKKCSIVEMGARLNIERKISRSVRIR